MNVPANRNYTKAYKGIISFTCVVSILSFEASDLTLAVLESGFNTVFPKAEPNSGGNDDEFRIFPQTLLIFVRTENDDRIGGWYDYLHRSISEHKRISFWPEIFLLNMPKHKHEITGFFMCWYCGLHGRTTTLFTTTTVFPIFCPDLQSCANEFVSVVKESVLNSSYLYWQWDHGSSYDYKLEGNACPFDRDEPARISVAVASFLYDESDRYLMQHPVDVSHFPIFKEDANGFALLRTVPIKIVYTGLSPRVNFITTSEAYSPKASSSVYFDPFAPAVWAAFGIVMLCSLLTALTVQLVHCKPTKPIMVAIMDTVLWKFCTVLGQDSFQPSLPYLSLKTLVANWLLGSTILVSVHLAIFSANSARLFPFLTTWEHLMDLENFTFRILISGRICDEYRIIETYGEGYTIESLQLCYSDAGLLFPECDFLDAARAVWEAIDKYMKNNRLSKNELSTEEQRKMTVADTLYLRSELVCNSLEHIRTACEMDKSDDRTAFLTYSYNFNYNWKLFKKLMSGGRGGHTKTRFANNFEKKDNFGVYLKSYSFTDGFKHESLKNFVRRFDILRTSGIYDFWEKWDRIRFSHGGVGQDGRSFSKEGTDTDGCLSFENSGLIWLFLVTMVGLYAAVLMFLLEVLVSIVKAKITVLVIEIIAFSLLSAY